MKNLYKARNRLDKLISLYTNRAHCGEIICQSRKVQKSLALANKEILFEHITKITNNPDYKAIIKKLFTKSDLRLMKVNDE